MSESEGGNGAARRVLVDARGLRCPLRVIRAAAVARDLPAGTVLTVLWSDPAARHDIPAWARMRGHQVVPSEVVPSEVVPSEQAADDAGSTTVRLGPSAASAPPEPS